MKSSLAIAFAAVTLLAAAPSWAQSLTPIQGWVPLHSPKAKALERVDTTVPHRFDATKSAPIVIPPEPHSAAQ
jgi:hypothetical protein